MSVPTLSDLITTRRDYVPLLRSSLGYAPTSVLSYQRVANAALNAVRAIPDLGFYNLSKLRQRSYKSAVDLVMPKRRIPITSADQLSAAENRIYGKQRKLIAAQQPRAAPAVVVVAAPAPIHRRVARRIPAYRRRRALPTRRLPRRFRSFKRSRRFPVRRRYRRRSY